MNKNFDRFLAMLESKASTPERKADIRAARELYRTGTLTEGWSTWQGVSNWGKSKLGNIFGSAGKDSSKYKDAGKSAEAKERDDKKAARMREVEEKLDKACEIVLDAAKWNPGQVDAWVDYRLRPAIKKAINTDDELLDSETKKGAFKEERAQFAKMYKDADKSEKQTMKDNLDSALKKANEEEAYKKEEEQTKAAEEKFNKERELAQKGQEKRDAAKNDSTENKWDATQSVGASEKDVRDNASNNRSKGFEERMAKEKEEAGKKVADSQPLTIKGDDGSDLDVDTLYKQMFGESVSTKKLRAAFESVYGDSRGYTDREIRMICESCYRRSKR